MTIGSICNRNVVVAPHDERVVDAARRMRMLHVGTVIVVEDRGDRRVPIGILTDRDIVLSLVAADAEHLPFLTIGDAMSDDPLIGYEDAELSDALKSMQERGVRRLPVVNRDGSLVGIISADDIVRVLAEEIGRLVSLMNREEQVERRSRL